MNFLLADDKAVNLGHIGVIQVHLYFERSDELVEVGLDGAPLYCLEAVEGIGGLVAGDPGCCPCSLAHQISDFEILKTNLGESTALNLRLIQLHHRLASSTKELASEHFPILFVPVPRRQPFLHRSQIGGELLRRELSDDILFCGVEGGRLRQGVRVESLGMWHNGGHGRDGEFGC